MQHTVNFAKYERYFGARNVTQIHNLLLHGGEAFATDREWEYVRSAHGFGAWGETTDGFIAFLIPYADRLYVTYQLRGESSACELHDVVTGVELTPYYLITTLDAAATILDAEA